MAIKKSELYSSLWASCDELRGGMDAGQYKDYVLVLLFSQYAGVPYAPVTLLERFMPRWKFYQEELNRLPVRYEEWGY